MNVTEELQDLSQALRERHRPLFDRFDPDDCIAAFDREKERGAYQYIPESVATIWSAVRAEFGESGFDAFQRVVMLRLIQDFEARATDKRYTADIRECFSCSFRRIVQAISDEGYDHYRSRNDLLLKDLGLCRQKIFPAGAQVVDPDSAFHRSLLLRGGLAQAFSFARLLVSTKGHEHWYQIHTHLSELVDFNPEGWDECYLRLAGMLELHPEVRGMWGGSWFYDPELESLSPRLSYLRQVPVANGARLYFSNVLSDGGALSKSKTRREAYERGEYTPKAYVLIWPRNELIDWALKIRTK